MSEKKYDVAAVSACLDGFLRLLLKSAGFDLDYEFVDGETRHPDFENPDVLVKFRGRDVDLLLANKAELLLALEHVSAEVMGLPSEDHARVSFDANDYRALRIEELRISAAAAADRVKSSGKPFLFNPMNSRERRIIHLSLRNEPTVRSESTGIGIGRHVVVYPEGMPSFTQPPGPPPRYERSGPRRGGPPDRRGRGRR